VDPPATVVDGHLVHCHVAARELAATGGDAATAAGRIAAAMAGAAGG
jgi:hypothetical protein